jgi:hypothetical protein
MSRLMEQVLAEVSQLPEDEQEVLASVFLREIESERHWSELFSRPGSARLLSRLADEALGEVRAGRARKLDVNEL